MPKKWPRLELLLFTINNFQPFLCTKSKYMYMHKIFIIYLFCLILIYMYNRAQYIIYVHVCALSNIRIFSVHNVNKWSIFTSMQNIKFWGTFHCYNLSVHFILERIFFVSESFCSFNIISFRVFWFDQHRLCATIRCMCACACVCWVCLPSVGPYMARNVYVTRVGHIRPNSSQLS